MRTSERTFCEEKEYYKKDWHDYYPTIIRLVPPNSLVLDIGCGRGGLLKHLRDKLNCKVVGIDISDVAIKICQEKGIKTILCNIEKEEIPGKYDVIILSAILEHLENPISLLNKIRSNLNKNGCVIIGVPNFSTLYSRIMYLFGMNATRYGKTKKDMKLGIQPPDHIRFFNKPTLLYILERCGYKPVKWSYYKPSRLTSVRMRLYYAFFNINPELFSVFIVVKTML